MLFASGVFSLYNQKDMNAILEALRDKAVALYAMDDSSPFQDYSGYNRTANMSAGTVTTAVALIAGAAYSSVFSSTAVGSFDAPVFLQGSEDKPFSLEATFHSIYKSGTPTVQQVLSHSGQYDGLTVNGTKIAFSTKYLTTGEARVEYDLQIPRRAHAVGVHTFAKNMLFVDGELVAEVEITEAQQADKYVVTNGKLYTGTTTSTQALAVNGLGIYAHALSPESVARHFAALNNHVDRETIPPLYGGVRIPLSNKEADIFLKQVWTSAEDWNAAMPTNVSIEDDTLKPQLANGVSVAGTWLDSFPLDAAGVTSVYGVNMTWDGEGAIVQASLDGVTWETAERGKNLALIPNGFNPTDKELDIRISFPGGVTDDPAFVDNLTITGFKTGASAAINGRAVTYTAPAYVKNDYEPIELRDDFGVYLGASPSKVTISASTAPDAVVPKTVEIWVKRMGGFGTTIAGATVYVNGAVSSTILDGEWQVRTYVLAAGITGDIVITGPAQIGQVVIYNDALTATQIKEIYDSYVGLPKVRALDNSVVTVTESAAASQIYAHDWSITGAG